MDEDFFKTLHERAEYEKKIAETSQNKQTNIKILESGNNT